MGKPRGAGHQVLHTVAQSKGRDESAGTAGEDRRKHPGVECGEPPETGSGRFQSGGRPQCGEGWAPLAGPPGLNDTGWLGDKKQV